MKRTSPLASLVAPALLGASLGLLGCVQLHAPGDPPPFPDGIRPSGPTPTFGQAVSLQDAPPPLSGGTLLMTHDGATAVAADPDRDRIVVVDTATRTVRGSLALTRGDEPGRSVEDGMGMVHVVLRGAGEIADVDPATVRVVGRRAVCPAPRGITFDSGHDSLVVACAGGELVRLPAAGGAATSTTTLDRDLRDVVVDSDGALLVTRLRTAEVLVLGSKDQIVDRVSPPAFGGGGGTFVANSAWRAAAIPGGGVIITHQRSSGQPVQITTGGYGSSGGGFGCGEAGAGIVHATASIIKRDAWGTKSMQPGPVLSDVVLPVDVAVNAEGNDVAVVAAGNAYIPGAAQVTVTSIGRLSSNDSCEFSTPTAAVHGEAIAAAYQKGGDLYIQTREPSTLQIVAGSINGDAPITIPLGGESRFDTGFAVFHSNSSAGLACASCHAEGGDDARTWDFAGLGPRRTQSLRGGITGRAPFHWSGDEADFTQLVSDVFVGRMSGPPLDASQGDALLKWVDRIPTLPPSAIADAAAVERGHKLFVDPTVACSSCHSGAKLTNNQKVAVGTAGTFKTPSLVNVGARAPYMHDGCAPTLLDRFGSCGGGDSHGHTSQLTHDQLSDLTAYLDTL